MGKANFLIFSFLLFYFFTLIFSLNFDAEASALDWFEQFQSLLIGGFGCPKLDEWFWQVCKIKFTKKIWTHGSRVTVASTIISGNLFARSPIVDHVPTRKLSLWRHKLFKTKIREKIPLLLHFLSNTLCPRLQHTHFSKEETTTKLCQLY